MISGPLEQGVWFASSGLFIVLCNIWLYSFQFAFHLNKWKGSV